MPFKPNYNMQRADRKRAQEQKKQEKLRRREEKTAKRKATQDELQVLVVPKAHNVGIT
jgi:hypothetical protein